MNNLFPELLWSIFEFLNEFDLIDIRSTCKLWNELFCRMRSKAILKEPMVYEYQLWKTHQKISSLANCENIHGYVLKKYFVKHLGLSLVISYDSKYMKSYLFCIDYMNEIYSLDLPGVRYLSINFRPSDCGNYLTFVFFTILNQFTLCMDLNQLKFVKDSPTRTIHFPEFSTKVKNDFTHHDIRFCSKTKVFANFQNDYPYSLIEISRTKNYSNFLIKVINHYFLISFDQGEPFVKERYKIPQIDYYRETIVICEKSKKPLIVEYYRENKMNSRLRNLVIKS